MSQGRRKHSPDCRAKVTLEAMRGEETAAQPAARHQVHSSQSQAWKKALTDGAAGVLGNGQDQKARSDQRQLVLPVRLATTILPVTRGNHPVQEVPDGKGATATTSW